MEHLVEALKDGTVKSILVDMYTPLKRKDLFNGSWFEVPMLLKAEISHGILLQGSAVGLADELERMIITQDVQTSYLQEETAIQDEEVNILFNIPLDYKGLHFLRPKHKNRWKTATWCKICSIDSILFSIDILMLPFLWFSNLESENSYIVFD